MTHKQSTPRHAAAIGLGALALAASAPLAHAASTLPTDFETGFDGWNVTGDAQRVTGHQSIDPYADRLHAESFSPVSGQWMALLSNNIEAGAADMSTSAPPGSPGDAATPRYTTGSTLTQTFDVNPGDTLSFQWLLDADTNGGLSPQTDQDIAFVSGSDGFYELLSNAEDFNNNYAWHPFSRSFDAADTVTVTIGVLEAISSDDPLDERSSVLLLDAAPDAPDAAPVPSPTAGPAGLFVLAVLALRRRRNSA